MRQKVFLGIGLLTLACFEPDGPRAPSDRPSRLQLRPVSGNAQSVTVGQVLPNPIVVRSADRGGDPASGVAVNWVILEGGGSLSESSVTTDGLGNASVMWTVGSMQGINRAAASVGKVVDEINGSPLAFTATALVEIARAVESLDVISDMEEKC